jgi:hypothetical protein
MAAPTPQQIERLGPETLPFGRSDTKTIDSMQWGSEDLLYTETQGVYNATDNNFPNDLEKITIAELQELTSDQTKEVFEKKYLWVIETDGLRIIKEKTINPKRPAPKQYVCHTNLTGAKNALQGGEMYFCEDGNVYINNKSDRYGCFRDGRDKNAQKDEVLSYLRTIYKRVFYLY